MDRAPCPSASRAPRFLRVLGGIALVQLAFLTTAGAHQVSPSAITLRPGGEDFFYVVDLGGCGASIKATSTSPGLVKVAYPHAALLVVIGLGLAWRFRRRRTANQAASSAK